MFVSQMHHTPRCWIAVLVSIAVLSGCDQPGMTPAEKAYTTWATYEADPGASHFSALDQIDRSNVDQLEIAWTYPVGDGSAEGFSPTIVDSTMFVVGPDNDLAALNAATGEELWTFSLPEGRGGDQGVLYWESPDRSERSVYIARGNNLYGVDARTGEALADFGADGRLDVRQGIDRDTSLVRATPDSPGTIFEDLIILGSATGEDYGSAPGHIRAFDARTGELEWVFHTIPHPGEPGYDTWENPDAWQTAGGANAWGGMSVDVERGMVYAPLGSATYDFYGADRLGANLYANSLIALDARTGELVWHYQTIHHDLWDYDLTATPTLLTVEHDGEDIDAVAMAAKTGFLFVFNRVNGEPLWEIEERPMPASDMPGEEAWPTQPFPTRPEPFAVQSFTADDINPYIPQEEQDSLRAYVAGMNNAGLYTPPSTTPTMQMPGNSGGANWGSTAADPLDGLFYVLTKNLPTVLTLEPVREGGLWSGADEEDRGQFIYKQNCQLCHLANLGGNPPMIPSLSGVTDRLGEEDIHAILREGRNTMPAFPDLSDEEVDDVIAYLDDPASVSPPPAGSGPSEASGAAPARYKTGYGYFSSSLSWAIKPPWMTMTAYDLNSGDILWQTPVGEVDDLAEQGITDTGARSLRGGPAVTEGGLLFMAVDNTARAYDRDTGEEIWSYELPAGIEGIPSVYEVRGRQYVVFGAGNGSDDAAPAYVAFALPQG